MSHRVLIQDVLTSIRANQPKIKRLKEKIPRVVTDEFQGKQGKRRSAEFFDHTPSVISTLLSKSIASTGVYSFVSE